MKLFVVKFFDEEIKISADTEQDAKILASHCCNKSVIKVLSVRYIKETNIPHFSTIKKSK